MAIRVIKVIQGKLRLYRFVKIKAVVFYHNYLGYSSLTGN